VAGLSLDDLVARTGHPRYRLEVVLREEVLRGRVVRDEDGRFAFAPGSLPADVVAALRGLSRPDVAAMAFGRGRPRTNGGQVSRSERRNLDWAVY
jgi:hypothetical protein